MADSFEIPAIGSVWVHVDAPGVRWQVQGTELIEAMRMRFITLEVVSNHPRSTTSIAIDSFREQYESPAPEHRPTQWERLLGEEIC